MKTTKTFFSAFKWVAAPLVLILATGACTRQMAVSTAGNHVQYVQTDVAKQQAIDKSAGIAIAQQTPAGPLAAVSPITTEPAKATAKPILKHSFAHSQNPKTIKGATAKNEIAANYISHRSSIVKNAREFRGGNLIGGIILLILGSILYIIPGPVGYILGTVLVILAVFIIIFAIL